MLTLDSPIEMQRPGVVRFGAGQVATLAAWLGAAGATRPFVVADRVNAARLDVLGLTDAEPLRRGQARARPAEPRGRRRGGEGGRADAVIGFGGGSAMDLAKLVAVLVSSDQAAARHLRAEPRAEARRRAGADPDHGGDRQRGRHPGADHRSGRR